MNSAERLRVLCVDDEPLVLEGLRLQLGRKYEMLTAGSGAEGLEVLRGQPTVAVVISDMRMPVMNGAAFLANARTLAPEATRILLTGQSEMNAAIAAVNEGQIFRFLTKPCPPAALLSAVAAAVAQHELLTAEKVLLEHTLQGCIRILTDVLALTNSELFGRATRVKQAVSRIATACALPLRWQVEMAAMLSQLALVSLPPETVTRISHGETLSDEETAMVTKLPQVADQLLAHIPRIEIVRAILIAAHQPFDAAAQAPPDLTTAQIGHAGQLLRAADAYFALLQRGVSNSVALARLQASADRYDPEMLRALGELRLEEQCHEREVNLMGLVPGMVLAESLSTISGVLIVTQGFEVTEAFMERVRNYRLGSFKEPIRVVVRGAAH